MIIVEDTSDSKQRPPIGPVPYPHSRPPSYHHTSESIVTPPGPDSYPKHPRYGHAVPSASAGTAQPLHPYQTPHPHRRSPAHRFCKALSIALVIYLAILAFTHTVVRMSNSNHPDDVGVPRPEDGRVLQSIGSQNWRTYHARPPWAPSFPSSAETSFTLPIDAEELYLLSRGAYQHGRVEVKQTTGRMDEGGVTIDVRVAYHDERALARARVCRMQKGGERHGVGIYTPTFAWTSPHDRLYFEVVMTFPEGSEADPRRVKALTTQTSNFAHEIGDLWQTMLFESVDVQASNAPIQAKSLTLTKGSLTSSNGAITGHFNTSDVLILRTSNGHIQATASLLSTSTDTTQLEMRTSNGPITSSVSLITPSDVGGAFSVKARTTNGALSLRYDESPIDSRLLSDARTSNAPATVRMHPAFEGTYEVGTSNGRPVVRDTAPVDPAGRGRRRVVRQTGGRDEVKGRVYWEGEGRRGNGVSVVRTSNGKVSLDL